MCGKVLRPTRLCVYGKGMTTTAAQATSRFTHVRVAAYRGYNVVDTQTNEVVAFYLGDGRSIHTGRTLAIRDAKARNAAAAK